MTTLLKNNSHSRSVSTGDLKAASFSPDEPSPGILLGGMLKKTARAAELSRPMFSAVEMEKLGEGWILDGRTRQLSPRTIEARAALLRKFLWHLAYSETDVVGKEQVQKFLAYLTTGHTEAGGRWQKEMGVNAHASTHAHANSNLHAKTNIHSNVNFLPMRPRSVWDYWNNLRCFFNWAEAEGYADGNPMASMKPPVHREDQINPFTPAQVSALLAAAKVSKYPRRDTALLSFLLDTGVRAAEMCSLNMKDLDVIAKRAWILGKGDKHRSVYFGRTTGKALWHYLREERAAGRERGQADAVFQTERGRSFQPNTVLQLFHRLGKAAAIEGVRCSPHNARRYFAIAFLRGGGNAFTLQMLLGHSEIKMTQRYVVLVAGDMENQHRQFSPMDNLK